MPELSAPKAHQIYALVNDAASQAMGTAPITVIDDTTLIALGNFLSSNVSLYEPFTNALSMRIGHTIYDFRAYTNKLSDMMLTDFEYGAILQKIKVKMPLASKEDSIPLEDGQEVNPWLVSIPKTSQKLFAKRTPYTYHVTIQTKWLKEAFTSALAMSSFISMIYGEVRNAINFGLENLGRAAQNNMIAETAGTSREVKLLTEYQADTGAATALTAQAALHDADFLRYVVRRINETRDSLTDMSVMYNDGTETRHTPYELQRIRLHSRFIRAAETVIYESAFNQKYIDLRDYTPLNFWQAEQSPFAINVKRASDGQETEVNDIIGLIYDRNALGMYQFSETVASTPINARALFYTVYWHENQLWFNDTSENFVLFTLS